MARFQGQNYVYSYHTNWIAKCIVFLRDDCQSRTSVNVMSCKGILSWRHHFPICTSYESWFENGLHVCIIIFDISLHGHLRNVLKCDYLIVKIKEAISLMWFWKPGAIPEYLPTIVFLKRHPLKNEAYLLICKLVDGFFVILFSNHYSETRIIFILNSITQTRVTSGHLVYWQLLIARARRRTGLVQIARNIYIVIINQKNSISASYN